MAFLQFLLQQPLFWGLMLFPIIFSTASIFLLIAFHRKYKAQLAAPNTSYIRALTNHIYLVVVTILGGIASPLFMYVVELVKLYRIFLGS